MPLLRPKKRSLKAAGLRPYTVLLCPFNGHQVGWCRCLCTPFEGHGTCGRLAPHAMIGRTQAAIAAFKAKRKPAR